MDNLNYAKLKTLIQNKKPAFFFDFDGTLADIVENYNEVIFTTTTRSTIESLSEKYFVGLLTGRSLIDIKNIISLPNLVYAGNHGLEIQMNTTNHWQHPDIPMQQLKASRQELQKIFAKKTGVKIENKNLSLAVHFRQAESNLEDWINSTTHNLIKKYLMLEAFNGKKVINIYPKVKWDKGEALSKIMLFHKLDDHIPIYFGDDSNDEPAFAMINANKGISVHVGLENTKSLAKFYIENPLSLRELIQEIVS